MYYIAHPKHAQKIYHQELLQSNNFNVELFEKLSKDTFSSTQNVVLVNLEIDKSKYMICLKSN